MVIYKCNDCGGDIESNCVYEGSIDGFFKFVEEKTNELSKKHGCKKHKPIGLTGVIIVKE